MDTQKDFMDEKGALYVPGAEGIKQNLSSLTAYAARKSYPVFGSVDRHYEGDAELKGPNGLPPHCMDRTEGQKKIAETSLPRSLFAIYELPSSRCNTYEEACLKEPWLIEKEAYIENRAHSANELKRLISYPAVYFEKQEFSMFSNANANLLTRFDAAVVYGVATEYCVKAAVLGMRQRGIDVLVVEDAIKGITLEGEAKAVEEMKAAGAKFIRTKDVLEGKVEQILNELWKETR